MFYILFYNTYPHRHHNTPYDNLQTYTRCTRERKLPFVQFIQVGTDNNQTTHGELLNILHDLSHTRYKLHSIQFALFTHFPQTHTRKRCCGTNLPPLASFRVACAFHEAEHKNPIVFIAHQWQNNNKECVNLPVFFFMQVHNTFFSTLMPVVVVSKWKNKQLGILNANCIYRRYGTT